MRAALFNSFGGPEVLEIADVEIPSPGAGQIRVAVQAAGVNAYDWKLRRGQFGGEPPKRVGLEFAGVVDAVGDGVEDVEPGDGVYGFAIGGSAAEFTLSAHYAPIPTGVSPLDSSGLPVAVETAWRVLDALDVDERSTIVINGASGAVGQAAVQLAVARGARVVGTASEARFAELRALGATPVLYGSGLDERIRALADIGAVTAGFDASGGGVLPDLVELAGGAPNVVTIADWEGAQAAGVAFSGQTSAYQALTGIAALIASQAFTVAPVRAFPLEQIADAQALSETGHAGSKLVLTL